MQKKYYIHSKYSCVELTVELQLTMHIYEAKTGELIWRMSKEMDEGTFSSANELVERMMRKVGRNFPFEKD